MIYYKVLHGLHRRASKMQRPIIHKVAGEGGHARQLYIMDMQDIELNIEYTPVHLESMC